MLDFDHLKKAAAYGGIPAKSALYRYLWHFKMSMSQALFLLLMFILRLIHAVFPFFLEFKLLEMRINELKKLKAELKKDPQMEKIKFDE